MADKIQSIAAEAGYARVEALGSVLDLQGLAKDMDKSEGSCVSLVSELHTEL